MLPDQEKIVKNVWKKNARNGGQNWIFFVPSQDINFFFRQNFRMKRLGKIGPGKRRENQRIIDKKGWKSIAKKDVKVRSKGEMLV